MLRAVRFAAKLDFALAPETAAPIAVARQFAEATCRRRGLFDELLEAVSERPRRAQLRAAAAVRSAALPVPRYAGAARDAGSRQDHRRSSARGLANTDERMRDDKPDHADVPVRVVPVVPDPGARAPARKRRLERRASDARSEPAHRRDAADGVPAPLQLADERAARTCSGGSASGTARARRGCCSTSASAPPTTSSCCARAAAKSIRRTVDWWTEIQSLPPEEQSKMLIVTAPPGRRRRGGRRRGGRAARDERRCRLTWRRREKRSKPAAEAPRAAAVRKSDGRATDSDHARRAALHRRRRPDRRRQDEPREALGARASRAS